ncbi:MAG: histidine kinase [Planctomycetota bacterium]
MTRAEEDGTQTANGDRAADSARGFERWLKSPQRLAVLLVLAATVATVATSLGEIELLRASGVEFDPWDVLGPAATLMAGWALAAPLIFALARALARAPLAWPIVAGAHVATAGLCGCLFLAAEIRAQEWFQGAETTADAAEAVAFIEELQAFRALPPDEQDAVLAERRAERRARREGARPRGDRPTEDSARPDAPTAGDARTDAPGPGEPPPEDGRRPPERRGDGPPPGFGRRRGARGSFARSQTGTTVNLATGDFAGDFERRWLLRVPRYGLVYLLLAGLGLGARAYLVGRDRERLAASLRVRAAELEGALSEARLAALQGQLHPHFLFNALHSVGGLIRAERGPEALTALDSIGDLLRTSLDAGGEQFVPLERELELTRRYLAVEELRLGERLRVEIDAAPGLGEADVPAFITQPLVENAVKHGIAARTEGGAVHVRARADASGRSLVVEIEDDGAGFDPGTARRGVGIAHVEGRLDALFDGAASLEFAARAGGGTVARLTLPLDEEPLGEGHGAADAEAPR